MYLLDHAKMPPRPGRARRGRHLRRPPGGAAACRDREDARRLSLPPPDRQGIVAAQRQAGRRARAAPRRRPARAGSDAAGLPPAVNGAYNVNFACRISRCPVRAADHRWELEVVRGREVGRRYALDPRRARHRQCARGGARPRPRGPGSRLAAADGRRQASSPRRARALTIRDLESPGGTFVNRQRLLAGQARALQPGDIVQSAPSSSRSVARPRGTGHLRRPQLRPQLRRHRPGPSLHARRPPAAARLAGRPLHRRGEGPSAGPGTIS